MLIGEMNVNTRLRMGVEIMPIPIVEDYFKTELYQWATVGNIMVTGGHLSCFISGGVGQDAVFRSTVEYTECYYDLDYSWGGSGWAQGTSNYIMINTLANNEASVAAAFAVDTNTGKVGVMYTDNSGLQAHWASNTHEANYGAHAFSRTRLYFKKAEAGAYPHPNGIIKLWYNDTLVVDLDDVNNHNADKITTVMAGNCWCDGDAEGVLYIQGVKVYKPCSFSGELQLESMLSTSTAAFPWKKIES
jgi:hypothetical protein